MKLLPEWNDRLRHWIATLEKDFYTPLESISFQGFATTEHLTPEAAAKGPFAPMEEGTQWGEAYSYCWMKSELTLPKAAQGKRIVMELAPGGEAALFVNGAAFGTRRAEWVTVPHHYFVDNCLTPAGKEGARFSLLMEVYAGHYFPESPFGGCATGPVLPGDYLDPKAGQQRATIGKNSFGIWNEDAYQLWLDAKTLLEVLQDLPESSLRGAKIARALQNFTLAVDFEQPIEGRILDYKKGREALSSALAAKNGSTAPTFYGIGNAHLDVAWLWPIAETQRKVARTFAAQLRLLEQYPDYRFLQSQPQTYLYCQQHYPELFQRIKAAIQAGNWIAEGGMWVEPDTNMTSGESLIRQLVHGLRYFKEELGVDCQILWLPDTFGYTATLPQILCGCGIRYLVTQKIFWSYNQGDQFPYHYFTWRGMDGSEVVSYLPTSYTYTTNPKELSDTWEKRVQKDDMERFLFPFGYGDGGGGPTRDHVEYALREQDLEGCPKFEMASPIQLFEDLAADGGPENTYVGELYFTAHRGVYTSQAGVKWGNRKSELALREGEIWGAIAQGQGFSFPRAQWDAAWKKVLLNQFHDILPGSSIQRVYKEAAVLHGEAIAFGSTLAADAANSLSGSGTTTLAFNSLSWERDVVVKTADGYARVQLPACGYGPVVETALPESERVQVSVDQGGALIQNSKLSARFDKAGELVSFVLKETGREFIEGVGNRFLLYKDLPRLFDAWDIDSVYEQQFLESGSGTEITLEEENPYRCTLQITKKIGNSSISQRVSLESGSIRLEFDTTVQWQELHRLLKVSFPVAVRTTEGINEMQFGFVRRPTHRSRQYDRDRFEVCNHRYTALCDEGHGAGVLNDCKYGVSMLENAINLTLLRAPASPELAADNGTHHFTYAFTAWEGPFVGSPVVRQGYELNQPVLLTTGADERKSFFSVAGAEGIVIDTIKPAEDGSGDLILRLYESKNASTSCELVVGIKAGASALCDMLENAITPWETLQKGRLPLQLRAFEVKTVRLRV